MLIVTSNPSQLKFKNMFQTIKRDTRGSSGMTWHETEGKFMKDFNFSNEYFSVFAILCHAFSTVFGLYLANISSKTVLFSSYTINFSIQSTKNCIYFNPFLAKMIPIKSLSYLARFNRNLKLSSTFQSSGYNVNDFIKLIYVQRCVPQPID